MLQVMSNVQRVCHFRYKQVTHLIPFLGRIVNGFPRISIRCSCRSVCNPKQDIKMWISNLVLMSHFRFMINKIAKPNNQKSLGVKDNSKDLNKVSKVG